MNGFMKKVTSGCLCGAVCLGMLAGTAVAEEEKPTADLSVSALSQYIWRGFAFGKDSMVLQPSMTVGYKGFSANVWGNLDTDKYTSSTVDENNWTETDYTLAYDWTMGKIGFSAGYIYYGLDGDYDTQELYLSASYDCLLAPTLTIYRDIDHLPGWYTTLGVSHSFAFKGDISLDLGAQISYLSADNASSYGEVVGGTESSTEEYSGFHDGLLSAAVSIPVGKYFAVSPEVYYSFPLSSDASDLLDVRNQSVIDDKDDSFIYGGVTVSMSF